VVSPVFSKRFIAVAMAAGGHQDAVVPAAKVWVVTHWIATCGTDNVLGYCLLYAPYPVPVAIYQEAATTNHVGRFQETRITLYAGETLRAATVATIWNIVISGYELTAAG